MIHDDREWRNALRSEGPDYEVESRHFAVCEDCGQAFDRRRLGDVIHHQQPGHEPLPVS